MPCSHAHIAAIPGADGHQRARMLLEKGVRCVLFLRGLVDHSQEIIVQHGGPSSGTIAAPLLNLPCRVRKTSTCPSSSPSELLTVPRQTWGGYFHTAEDISLQDDIIWKWHNNLSGTPMGSTGVPMSLLLFKLLCHQLFTSRCSHKYYF